MVDERACGHAEDAVSIPYRGGGVSILVCDFATSVIDDVRGVRNNVTSGKREPFGGTGSQVGMLRNNFGIFISFEISVRYFQYQTF